MSPHLETQQGNGINWGGYVLDFSGPNLPTIVGATLDPRSTFAPDSVGLSFDADTVRINGSGLFFGTASHILVDVTLVPEPETYAMLLAGLGLLGFIARRRRTS